MVSLEGTRIPIEYQWFYVIKISLLYYSYDQNKLVRLAQRASTNNASFSSQFLNGPNKLECLS